MRPALQPFMRNEMEFMRVIFILNEFESSRLFSFMGFSILNECGWIGARDRITNLKSELLRPPNSAVPFPRASVSGD
jgi:hypothetical protein